MVSKEGETMLILGGLAVGGYLLYKSNIFQNLGKTTQSAADVTQAGANLATSAAAVPTDIFSWLDQWIKQLPTPTSISSLPSNTRYNPPQSPNVTIKPNESVTITTIPASTQPSFLTLLDISARAPSLPQLIAPNVKSLPEIISSRLIPNARVTVTAKSTASNTGNTLSNSSTKTTPTPTSTTQKSLISTAVSAPSLPQLLQGALNNLLRR